MGLSIEVGILADLIENDEEGAAHCRQEFATLNKYLASVHLPQHSEPEKVRVWSTSMFGYSGLHYLRRIAAHLDASGKLPEPGDTNSAQDPMLVHYGADFPGPNPLKPFGAYDHLIIHSDAEGYYLPQDFPCVLFPGEHYPVAGGMVGSSPQLLKECKRVADALKLPLDLDPESDEVHAATQAQGSGDVLWKRYGVESFSCLRLYVAAAHSTKTGAAIVFT